MIKIRAFIEDSLQRCSKQVFSVASEPTYHAAQTMYDIPKVGKLLNHTWFMFAQFLNICGMV